MRASFTQASDFHRERDFGQKISATMEFIGAHWRGLGRVLAYLVLPVAIVRGMLSVLVQPQALGLPTGHSGPAVIWTTVLTSPAYWLSSLAGSILFALLVLSVYAYVMVLAKRRAPGPQVAVAEVWAVVRREFVGVFFSLWGVGVLVGIGFVLLVVPGLYLSVALSLFFVVKVAEGTGFGATLRRCLHLTRGKWWSTFGLIAVAVLLLYVVIFGTGAVAVMAAGGVAAALKAANDQSPLVTVALTSLGSVGTLLLYPPLLLALAFQYFNLVERREGAGLRLLVDALGQPAGSPLGNAALRPDEEGEY